MFDNCQRMADYEKRGREALDNGRNPEAYADLALMSHFVGRFW